MTLIGPSPVACGVGLGLPGPNSGIPLISSTSPSHRSKALRYDLPDLPGLRLPNWPKIPSLSWTRNRGPEQKGVPSLIRCFSQAKVGDAVTATWTTLQLRNSMNTRTYRTE